MSDRSPVKTAAMMERGVALTSSIAIQPARIGEADQLVPAIANVNQVSGVLPEQQRPAIQLQANHRRRQGEPVARHEFLDDSLESS